MNVDRIMRLAEVKKVTGLGGSTVYDKMKAGTFPRQVPLGQKTVGWLESEVIKWQQARIAARNEDAPVKRAPKALQRGD